MLVLSCISYASALLSFHDSTFLESASCVNHPVVQLDIAISTLACLLSQSLRWLMISTAQASADLSADITRAQQSTAEHST